jgi:hypothetical protein
MNARSLVAVVSALFSLAPIQAYGQSRASTSSSTSVTIPERAVRRDIPMTRMIQRAFAAGTRDSTGLVGTTGSSGPTTESTRASTQRPRSSPVARPSPFATTATRPCGPSC